MFGQGAKPTLSKKQGDEASKAYESKIGIEFSDELCEKVGYLANVKPTTYTDSNSNEFAALLMYFIGEDGNWSKGIFPYLPYFYLLVEEEAIREIVFQLNKEYATIVESVEIIQKEDLELVNHLSGKKSKYVKLSFRNVSDLMNVRLEITPIVKKNKAEKATQDAYEGWYNQGELVDKKGNQKTHMNKIIDIREYDVPYHIRAQIDNEIRCSFWYKFSFDGPRCTKIEHLKDKLDKADLRVMAFDIETTKSPLKFPDVRFDQVMMISYIVDGCGFLITNREVVGADVKDFEYAPRPEFDVGTFTVFNEANEKELLVKWFEHIRETKPFVFTTFNGDYFDWPFIQNRAEMYDLKIEDEIGVYNFATGEYTGRFASHMDCLYWVKRDAYLPQGSHGLKKVTKAKLGYDPVELDPELMVPYAKDRPQELAEYSVSDSVATYFLYMKMIHDFIFALCTIIPTYPDEVLRRGSGTLCEDLLMAQAFRGNIIFPNKQQEDTEKFIKGQMIDFETYIGGHVECLRTGVYRSDFEYKFKLEASGYQSLIDKVDDIMGFALKVENNGIDPSEATNYEEVKQEIVDKLMAIKQRCPIIEEKPLIYHVDVAAMYPNIILSNRLQPVAIVNEKTCAGCVFNKEENDCKRDLDWQWKGDVLPLNRREYEMVKGQLQSEFVGDQSLGKRSDEAIRFQKLLKERIRKFCSMNYGGRGKTTQIELKTDTVCMRENPFYVDTVRDFRDRRYEFKRLVKVWISKLKEAKTPEDIETAKNRVSLYESLQLAHKIILNSFYGYVMRRGARWYSMEMAAMVTHAGGSIIKDSRELFDVIGMPLELDTDGIWTLLPKSFPEGFTFTLKDGKTAKFDFPCTMCNHLIYDKYGNKQYQTLVDKNTLTYEKRTEMSIFFEIDGPYHCMLIPASKEENKMLKKRYAVFNHAGKMTEVKGFELKRRGELEIIKIFQGEVFEKFLEGESLQECYDACGEIADRWYDILETKGEYVDDIELIDYISESRVIQKPLHEYGTQKSTPITCAKRLAELLGNEIIKDKGLNVKFIISKQPETAKVTDRAIPTVIFEYQDEVIKKKFLRKWLGEGSNMVEFDLKSLIDWDYYKERLSGTIMKIVTIPAALQKCLNPVPRIAYPDWLHKRLKAQDDKFKQKDMRQFFKIADMEDLAKQKVVPKIEQSSVYKVGVKSDKQASHKLQIEEDLNMEDCPLPENNFKSWLKHQKCNWRRIRKDIKSEKKLVPKQGSLFNTGFGGQQSLALANFMRNMDETVLNSNWHIISIEQTYEHGVLKVWAMTESKEMFNIKLNVSRTVYINSKVVSDDADFRKVQKTLPRNRKSYHLYEYEMSEEQYRQKFHELQQKHMTNNTVEGIYETKVPPKFRSLIELGAIVKPKKKMIPRQEQALGRMYKIGELENKPPVGSDQQYLPAECYERVFLLHSTGSRDRHFWGVFIEATKEIQFFVVNPVKNIKNQSNVNLKNIFANGLEELGQEVEFAAWQNTEPHFVHELPQALKLIDQKLQEHKSKNKGATILVLQSTFDAEWLQLNGLPTLVNEFPVMKFGVIPTDNEYPPLHWIQNACKNMTIRFTEAGDWLDNRVCYARYSFIPVCNLEDDSPQLFMIDLAMARNLSMSKHLIWYSDSAQPDLGGHEDRNYRSYYQEEIENPELNKKGFYRYYTVEVEVGSLAINTILQSDFLREFEDAQELAAGVESKKKGEQKQESKSKLGQEFDTDLDEFVTCKAAFGKLKDLMTRWLQDIHNDDEYADDLMSNVYRWLSSGIASKMYDPLLHRLVHKLMKKNFFQLLLQLRQLGCEVVYGSFNKMYLHTKKRDFEEAKNSMDFVFRTIRENDMFSWVTFTPIEYWRCLLFKDIYNYAGIKESNPESVLSRWDISLHLPEAIQQIYKHTVGEYLLKVYRYNEKLKVQKSEPGVKDEDVQMESVNASAEPEKIQVADLSVMDTVEDFKKEPDHEFICKLIDEHFSQKMFEKLTNIQRMKSNQAELPQYHESSDEEEEVEDEENQDGEGQDFNQVGQTNYEKRMQKREKLRRQQERERWEFPQRIGSYNNYSVPALEFTKMIYNHVFSLDPAFELNANTLKKNLLRLIHQKEFSPDVMEGTEPSLILVIPDFICEKCQHCQDVDICRDDTLNSLQLEYENAAQLYGQAFRPVWRCKVCENDLNLGRIEKRLIDLLNRRVVTYQMQDLKCVSCRMVANSLMSARCQCTGKFEQTIGNMSPEKLTNPNLLNQMTDIRLFVRLLRNFGNLHQMRMLQETAEKMMLLMQVQ